MIFAQIFSVVPGKLVDSKITKSLCLIIFDIKIQAFFNGFKSGCFFLFTGVGTVMIRILQSPKSLNCE